MRFRVCYPKENPVDKLAPLLISKREIRLSPKYDAQCRPSDFTNSFPTQRIY